MRSDRFDLSYISLFEALPGRCVLLLNDAPRYSILAATPGYLAQISKTASDIVGKGIFEAFPGNEGDEADTGTSTLKVSLEYVLQQREPHYVPIQRYDVEDEDGKFVERYWRASNKPVFDPDGELAFIVLTAEDITGQAKAAEMDQRMQGLQESEHDLRSLVSQAPMGICVIDTATLVCKMVNQSFAEITGKQIDEISGSMYWDTFADARPYYEEALNRVIREGITFRANGVEVPLHVPGNKEVLNVTFVYEPIKDDNGVVKKVVVWVIDNTAQVMALRKIEESQDKYKRLFNSLDDGFCTIDVLYDKSGKPYNYRFLEVNKAFEQQTGLNGAVGMTMNDYAVLEDFWYETYGNVAVTGEPVRFEHRAENLHRFYDVYAFKIGTANEHKVAVIFSDITERKEAEEAIRESQKQLAFAMEAAELGVWDYNPVTQRFTADERFREWHGLQESDEMNEAAGLAIVAEADRQKVIGAMNKALTWGGGNYDIEYSITNQQTGQERIVRAKGKTTFDTEHVAQRLNGTLQDVTLQAKARKQIEESEERFRSMADASPLMIWTLDAAGNSTYYNKTTTQFTGHTEQELKDGKSWQTAIHPADILYAGNVVSNAVRDSRPYQMECRIRRADGEWRWLLSHGTPRINSNNELLGYVGSSVDITEHKNSQQELRTALEQTRLSKEAAELGTFDLDLEAGTMHWDDRCRTLFGISHDRAVSFEKDFLEGLHEDDRERIIEVINQLFDKSVSNGDYDVEYRTVGAEDNVVRWVRAKGKVYFNEQDKPVRFIGSVLDITEKVTAIQGIEALVDERTKELAQANEALQKINNELQRSNQNLEEFAHAASHDLKEPIRKILFFTNQLKDQLSSHLKDTELRSFNRIENATERMGNLIDDLLLYSHVSQRPPETEDINLNQKIQNVLEDLELHISEKNAVINVEKFPVVKGYRRQLQQLFQNLISNALKYSKAEVAPLIDIRAEKVTEDGKLYHLFSVQDNGIGFESEYVDKIFQMFTRLHGKGEYSGTGVGLSIVKKVVENHNGFIRVESAVGEGSTFKIYLPVLF